MSNVSEGALSWTKDTEEFLNRISDANNLISDSPFSSAVEAFRFAFILGYTQEFRKPLDGTQSAFVRSAFSSNDYVDLVEKEASSEGMSLGQVISQYVEGGVELMIKQMKKGTLLELIL
jgi:hypothetical protein